MVLELSGGLYARHDEHLHPICDWLSEDYCLQQ